MDLSAIIVTLLAWLIYIVVYLVLAIIVYSVFKTVFILAIKSWKAFHYNSYKKATNMFKKEKKKETLL